MEREVVEPAASSDHVVRQTRRVAGHLEHQEADRLPDRVGEDRQPPERHAVGVIDHHGAQREDVFVEAPESIEVGGEQRHVTECHSAAHEVFWAIHEPIVTARSPDAHR
ncbi:MAG: hypothetical protein R2713_04425 [Ilumatobacteraceae bacterium]